MLVALGVMLIPAPPTVRYFVLSAVGLAGLLGMAVTMTRRFTTNPGAAITLPVGAALFWCSYLIRMWQPHLVTVGSSSLSPVDVLDLSAIVFFTLFANVVAARRDQRVGSSALVESLIFGGTTTGIVLILSVFPMLNDPALSGARKLSVAAFDACGIFGLFAIVRLMLTKGERTMASEQLVVASLLGLFVAFNGSDAASAIGPVNTTASTLTYALLALASFHPTFRSLSLTQETVRRDETAEQFSRRRLAIYGIVLAEGPFALYVVMQSQPSTDHDTALLQLLVLNVVTIVGTIIRLARIVVLRTRVVRAQQRYSALTARLLAATTAEEIVRTTAAGLQALVGGDDETTTDVYLFDESKMSGGLTKLCGEEDRLHSRNHIPLDEHTRVLLRRHSGSIAGALGAVVRPDIPGAERTTLLTVDVDAGADFPLTFVTSTTEFVPDHVRNLHDSFAASAGVALRAHKLLETASRKQSEAQLSAVLAAASDLVIVIVDADGSIRFASPSAKELFFSTEVSQQVLVERLASADRDSFTRMLRANAAESTDSGRTCDARVTMDDGFCWYHFVFSNVVVDETSHSVVISATDVTDRILQQELLQHQAHHDALTGLKNRPAFMVELTRAIRNSQKGSEHNGSVLFLDLDDFKHVNDSLGHECGDAVLVEATRRITAIVGSDNPVARFGGDEFAVLLAQPETTKRGQAIARRIIAALSEPIMVSGHLVSIGASIGIAPLDSGVSGDQLLKRADVAMYSAKRSGKNRVFVSGFSGESPVDVTT